MLGHAFREEMVVLFAILVLGYGLGRLSIRGISLGTGGVLFSALVFGHFGHRVPKEVMDLGLLLFVYAVGLQAGPRFFRSFRETGSRYIVIALASLATGTAAAVLVGWYLGLRYDLAVGLFTGALTNTPALAAAIDLMKSDPGGGSFTSVGYGIAYPFSMLGVVLLIQFLPKLLRRPVVEEEERWRRESESDFPALTVRQFLVTNPNCDGRTIREVNPRRASDTTISRIRRGNEIFTGHPDFTLYVGDVARAVGSAEELDVLRVLLGEDTQVSMDINRNIVSVDVDVTDPSLSSRTLRELQIIERSGVVITRIRREGAELVPRGTSILLLGDQIRVVGEQEAVGDFVKVVGGDERRLEETTMAPFLFGLLLGVLIGNIPFSLSPAIHIKLGSAGGAFVTSLILGHFGSAGRFRFYVPQAAKNLSRELGLMLFLAGAGTTAGSRFMEVLMQQGASLFIGGAAITIITVSVILLFAHVVYKMNVLATMGVLSACMTNPPGLGAATAQTQTELPTLAYASVYPVALIGKIVIAQILVEFLRR
ncbi:MAG: hypothetical protein IT210_05870 [Armatimonadetes bacterium]|nr:hypothetical protein [Armatimonadota bacterium]